MIEFEEALYGDGKGGDELCAHFCEERWNGGRI